ncbi:MAG TPA: hypothetical protein VF265_01175 [Nevskiaceae bacterium]
MTRSKATGKGLKDDLTRGHTGPAIRLEFEANFRHSHYKVEIEVD